MRILRLAAAGALGAFVALVACSSDPPKQRSFCETVRSASSACGASAAPCDTTVTEACELVERALSPSARTATLDCLDSGVCGVASCLARAQANAKPSAAHEALAAKYCASCANANEQACTTEFYAKRSKLPGGLVLPYPEAVAKAVEDTCTADPATCRATFSTCATETVARLTREATSEPVAVCVTARRDDGEVEGLGAGGFTLATCTPQNCQGCCRDDKCEEGGSSASCGSGAVSCQSCSGLQKCKDGTCQEPCGPTNCDGCCDGDVCRDGKARDRCGEGGAKCIDCATSGAGFVCTSQKCIDASCRTTCTSGCCTGAGCQTGTSPSACGTNGEACVNCGPGRTCNAASRTCALDTSSTWDFFVASASLPPTTKSGSAWDVFGGLPDPYLRAFSSEGASTHDGKTSTLNDTLSPAYNAAPLRGIRASELISNTFVDIWDEDVEFDDLVGGCRIPISTANFDGRLYSFTCSATPENGEVRVVFRLVKSP